MLPDLPVEVRDCVAQGDKAAARNVWAGAIAQSGRRVEYHGFVRWRTANGKIAGANQR
jgi:ketosteroid isomerase-like protein